MKYLTLLFIRFYQLFISPLLGGNCRFNPTCSQYALECFENFSFFKALWYSFRRIVKCHPFHEGGNDPVPHKNDVAS